MCTNGDDYEISDPLTIGGATGSYSVPSPYHTECEWTIISATMLGNGTVGSYSVGSKNPSQPTLSATGANLFGQVSTSSPDNNNALGSYVGALTQNTPCIVYAGIPYMPLPSPAFVYLQTSVPASTGLYVTLQFRRKLDRVIPDKPRQRPQTHGHVVGRRNQRTMMEGFAAQYPGEGHAYQHQGLPEQDTEIAKRGVLPLGPTTMSHRGKGGKPR